MADSQVPGTPGDTGVQRTLGERRRRRAAERTGQVDLDATMSQWPVTEPPGTPRPVVRPARPTIEGVATGPVLPTPGAMVVGPLLEARNAAAPRGRRDGSRRSRRGSATSEPSDPGTGGPDPVDGDPAEVRADAVAPPGPGAGAAGATSGPMSPAGPVSPFGPVDTMSPFGPVDTMSPFGPGGATGVGARPGTDPDETPTGPQPTVPGGLAVTTTPTPRPAPAEPRRPRALLAEAQGDRSRRRGLGGRWLVVGAAILLVAVLVAVLVVVLRPEEDGAQAVEPTPEVPAQQTVALVLEDATGAGVVGAALVGVDSAEVSTLLLPADLLLTVADAGPLSVAEAAALGGEPVRRGLEDTLVVRVDGVVLVASAQLATLVDAVGGVVVDVTTGVVTDSVLVAVGDDQRLAGAQAVAYASAVVDGEPAEARLARLGAVVQALLAALPADAADAAAALQAAGLEATAGLSASGLADTMSAAAARAAAGNAQQALLPTEELVAGGAARRGVDDDAARPELASRFAGALLPVAAVGEVRVLVRNAVGRPGLGAAARDLLVADGLRFVGSGNAASFGGQPMTAVLVASQTEDDRRRGEAVAAALGLDDTALQVNSETLVDTDVVVVLGDDFALALAGQTTDAGTEPGTPTTGDAP